MPLPTAIASAAPWTPWSRASPFVEKQMDARAGASRRKWIDHDRQRKFERSADGSLHWDLQAQLQTMVQNWRGVFGKTLGHASVPWLAS